MDWANDDNDETSDHTLTNVSLGGLSFISLQPLEILQRIRVCVPVIERSNFFNGTVVWCEKSTSGFEIGLEFESSRDMYRLRMIEQICHIEHYRKEVERTEGRHLTNEQAAKEWISRYAGDFPAL